jgi:hypothetical protein
MARALKEHLLATVETIAAQREIAVQCVVVEQGADSASPPCCRAGCVGLEQISRNPSVIQPN